MSDLLVDGVSVSQQWIPTAKETIQTYDLCLAWNWPFDADFARLLADACREKGVSLLQITPDNLESTLLLLIDQQVSFRVFFDRASDTDDRFNPLVLWARQQGVLRINPYRLARRAWDKAGMHATLARIGLCVPEIIPLPSFQDEPELPPQDLSRLGDCFVVKPTHGGGGNGVVLGVSTWNEVQAARQRYPHDSYLVQSLVRPAFLDGRQAWFRVIYCAGQVFPCWWEPRTHCYAPVTWAEQSLYGLHPLRELPILVARACQLNIFSSEIALTPDRDFILVDYVNDPIDLRLQSRVAEGVPDAIIHSIARSLAAFTACGTHDLPLPGSPD